MRDHTTRVQKNTTLTLDHESERMLQEIADQDELQPGNRSHTVRRLIRQEYRRMKAEAAVGT